METAVVKIRGMTCTGCVNSVKNVLQKISGVSSADVSLEQAQATIQYDATTTNANQFKDAIKEAGFEVINK
jgi:copper chaperone